MKKWEGTALLDAANEYEYDANLTDIGINWGQLGSETWCIESAPPPGSFKSVGWLVGWLLTKPGGGSFS